MQSVTIDRNSIVETAARIAPHVRRTAVAAADGAEFGLDGTRLFFKLEHMQHAGSFKTRGAFANLLARPVPGVGVVAASGGNHGAAVAYAAMKLGVPAKIFVPAVSSAAKIERIRSYGARLEVGGERYADALRASEEWIGSTNAMAVHAFDQPHTLLGQGTIALETQQQLPQIDTMLVAVGGGGLIGGIAAYFGGTVRVIGVEPEGAPTLTWALEAGRPVDAPAGSIANDSLAPKRAGELMFPIAQQFVERVVLVSDDDIMRAQSALWRDLSVLVEPGGAAAFAALLAKRYVPAAGECVCVLLSGANTPSLP
ncbi:MAG: threonine/serine dehydratase [Candidatus Baltobacteraceae bacterium]